jgi:hypothetical protein
MVLKLDKVVPFGRSFDEYVRMFNLSTHDLQKRILGVGDGPASFNAEGTQLGYDITSIDPIYQFNSQLIKQRFEQVVDSIIQQVENTPNDWVWTYHQSPKILRENRVNALNKFLEDYSQGKQERRYQVGELPHLNLPNGSYHLALCSHFLFLYSDHYDYQFHLESILEMLRISSEVRIFPLLTLMLEKSPYLPLIQQDLRAKGYQISVVKTAYEFQKGGNEMLVISGLTENPL